MSFHPKLTPQENTTNIFNQNPNNPFLLEQDGPRGSCTSEDGPSDCIMITIY